MNIFAELMMQTEKPSPMVFSELDGQFWANCADRKLCFQRCDGCGAWRHLPRYLCADCGSDAWHWEQSAGAGSIYSWTVVHLAIHPAFTKDVPYTVGIIEMDEGVRMVSIIDDIDPAALDLGLRVTLHFDAKPGDPVLPRFRPVAG